MEREDAQREDVGSAKAAQSLAIPPQSLPDFRPRCGLACHDVLPFLQAWIFEGHAEPSSWRRIAEHVVELIENAGER
jgi:hypothetical protein